MNRDVRAEAVAWLARLQASGRDRATERGLRKWLKASPEHAAEFERATDVWEDLGGVPAAAMRRRTPEPQRAFWRWPALAAVATSFAALLIVAYLYPRDSDLSTRIGEQRMVTLPDGSRVTLNTNSRVTLASWDVAREVRLDRGEAYFEVAKDTSKPFVVVAGDKKVIAIGTAFVVRRQPQGNDERISVTMVEGKVTIADADAAPRAGVAMPDGTPTLVAGQRLVLAKSTASSPQIDLPRIDAVTAWRRGEVVLDNTALRDAIVEMNRYSATSLDLDNEAIASLPVSGIFRAGDSDSFATAVATLYGLAVTKEPHRLLLSRSASR